MTARVAVDESVDVLDDAALLAALAQLGLEQPWVPRPAQMPPDQNPQFADVDTANNWFLWFFRAGRGCVAAGTRVWDPIAGRCVAVEDRTSPGWVLALDDRDGEPVPAMASASFKKGEAPLFRVETERGDVVTTTDQHRFLTPSGWVHLADIGPGDAIASCGPSAWPSDDLRSIRTCADSLADCRPRSRSCGPPLRQAQEDVRVWLQRQGDALARIGHELHADVVGRTPGCNRLCRGYGHLPRNGFGRPELMGPADLSRGGSCDDEWSHPTHLDETQSGGLTTLARSALGSCRYQAAAPMSQYLGVRHAVGSHLGPSGSGQHLTAMTRQQQQPAALSYRRDTNPMSSGPHLDYASWQRVRSITPVGIGAFYDLTVEGHANYLAEGLWHHNTGKTRSAAEWLSDEIEDHGPLRATIIGPTFADGRDTMMEGESGLLNVLPGWLMPKGRDRHWNRSIGELNLVDGSYVRVHASERPGRLRGPQWHLAWLDEPAEFADADLGLQADTTIFNLFAGLRLGERPRCVVTGTPKPVKLIKEIIARCETRPTWFETRGSTYDNLDNLAPTFRDEVVSMYEGTAIGRQELEGDLVEAGGEIFDPSWLTIAPAAPSGRHIWRARCWDLAATEPHDDNRDPDWTVGVLAAIDRGTRNVVIEHVARFRARPGRRDDLIKAVAIRDRHRLGTAIPYHIELQPGGEGTLEKLQKDLDGIVPAFGHRPKGSKYERALPAAAAMEQGRVSVLLPAEIGDEVEWDLAALTTELREFRADEKHAHDDQIDALSLFWVVTPDRDSIFAASPATEQKEANRVTE